MTAGTDSAAVETPPRQRLTISGQITLSLLWLSLNFQSGAFYALVVPAQVLLFITAGRTGSTAQGLFISAIGIAGGVVTLVLQPLAGLLSDRGVGAAWISSRGKRTPFITLGLTAMAAGTVILAFGTQVLTFVAGFLLVQLGGAVCTGAYQGLLPDKVPPEQRGAASGFMGLMTILGTLGSIAIAGWLLGGVTSHLGHSVILADLRIFYACTIALLALGLAVSVLAAPGRCDQPSESRTARLVWSRELWLGPMKEANFRLVFFARLMVLMGLTIFMTYVEYYFARVSHVTHFAEATAVVALLALVGAVASSILIGIWSDRVRRVPLVFLASNMMALTALAFTFWQGEVPLIPLGIIFGLGFGAYLSVDWALAVDVLPSLKAAGKDMGIWSVASILPALLAPLVGGVTIGMAGLLGAGGEGYRDVFGVAVIFFAAGAFLILGVRDVPFARTLDSRPNTALSDIPG